MAQPGAPEVLVVSLASTEGLRAADEQLLESLLRAGARAALVQAHPPTPKRTLMATDLAWALAARAAASDALVAAGGRPVIIYSSTTAALLWPRPGAIRFDAAAAGNRPGRHGYWQRPLERRRLAHASMLLPWSEGALAELAPALGARSRALVLPVAVERETEIALRGSGGRDIAAITYAANPAKKGLDRVLATWRRLRAEGLPAGGGELVIAGAEPRDLRRAGLRADEAGVRVAGALPHAQYVSLLARARIFVCAPRREDYGIAQLEALAHGCLLVSTPAPGPYVALPIAATLDPRLVSEDLARSLAVAVNESPEHAARYAERAQEALAPFERAAVDALVAQELLPRVLGQGA